MKMNRLLNTLNGMQSRDHGFTLIELLVTLVIAMVILAGLLLTFTQQYGEYKYQNARVDSVQDLEFAIQFIGDDLRSALVGTPTINIDNYTSLPRYTKGLGFTVWDESQVSTGDRRAVRCYLYLNNKLYYDRNYTGACGSTLGPNFKEFLPNVTYFKVFQDVPGSVASDTGLTFTGAPVGLQALNIGAQNETGADNGSFTIAGVGAVKVKQSSAGSNDMPGYTILIETSVDAGYKQGSFVDVMGNNVGSSGKKRIWRYVQVHPMSPVD